ncbi:E3 ubiquitin-protein ligase RNF170-like isoform X4 [Numida meleagris]|uniref:E3 ubiquitin-protein ligase RNF170-like isoform X4 n=1 Tax=Numida meleagris TaxID=8996 RepID=UPI000B3E0B3F|nr:E3 ubiquitin-protein ligase RNF170-like isoform X4 [Numida meleagris]
MRGARLGPKPRAADVTAPTTRPPPRGGRNGIHRTYTSAPAPAFKRREWQRAPPISGQGCRCSHQSREFLQIQQPSNHSDFSCPICLQTVTLPVETNCGHLFCGSCLITYWKHSLWLGAIMCPLCRQKVVVLDNISCEKLHDKPSKQIVHDIRAYNKRFSGQPRPRWHRGLDKQLRRSHRDAGAEHRTGQRGP